MDGEAPRQGVEAGGAARGAPRPLWGWRIAEALNVGTVAGLLIATAAMFWSNRLIPASLPGREGWEMRVFFAVWALCALCALWRARRLIVPGPLQALSGPTPRRLWAEQLGVTAALYGLLPMVSAVMSPGSALWVTLPGGQTAVAGFDLTMLGAGLLLALVARKVSAGGETAVEDSAARGTEGGEGGRIAA